MNSRILSLLIVLCLAFSSTACSKAGGGALAGAGLGAAAGALTFKNKKLGAMMGGGAGLILGYMVGNSMDMADARQVQNVAETSRSGVPMQWKNSSTGRSYQATAGPATLNADGLIQRNIDIVAPDGRVMRATWCRDEFGEWFLAER